ncbi:hypothetical protein MtrunA17_Chr1g0155931 [Medicago truncatula]|uniref:Transmembrane protein n=1 Tax=Medicago truncatula TaxID=3880 RepID=A0A396JK27_MEDTR|nr:hypothetical protein MtrunA17_Chr1g0155931 [Medicago truncatula]
MLESSSASSLFIISLTSFLSVSNCPCAASNASTSAVLSFPVFKMSIMRTASRSPLIIAPPTVSGCSLQVASPAKNKQLSTGLPMMS